MTRPDWNTYFMQIARVVATRSTCLDKQVGCVLVDDEMHILACGYNGAPRKAGHCIDVGTCHKETNGNCIALHAEVNALEHCQNDRPLICYCTLEPCKDCAKLLRNAGVEIVYYAMPTNPEKSGREVFGGHWAQLPRTSFLSSNASLGDLVTGIREYHHILGYPQPTNIQDDGTISARAKLQGQQLVLAAAAEVFEVLNAFNWKPWKEYEGAPKVDRDNFVEEVGDVIFFLDSLLMNFGISWEELTKVMSVKLNTCYLRLDNGYHN